MNKKSFNQGLNYLSIGVICGGVLFFLNMTSCIVVLAIVAFAWVVFFRRETQCFARDKNGKFRVLAVLSFFIIVSIGSIIGQIAMGIIVRTVT